MPGKYDSEANARVVRLFRKRRARAPTESFPALIRNCWC